MYHFELTPGPRAPRERNQNCRTSTCAGEWFSYQSVDVDLRSAD
jgi:hypothetical protein